MKKRATLGFCYLCGGAIDPRGSDVNRDHVPPTVVFNKLDRAQPLHRKDHAPKNLNKLRVSAHKTPGRDKPAFAVSDLKLEKIILRWIRGFHAALYGGYLPAEVNHRIHPPLPRTDRPGGESPIDPIHHPFVEVIKKNRAAGNTDRIVCRNGKCQYECVWSRTDGGENTLCVFALDVYGWSDLGDIDQYPARSCVGTYAKEVPTGAAFDSPDDVPFTNRHPLDAFAD